MQSKARLNLFAHNYIMFLCAYKVVYVGAKVFYVNTKLYYILLQRVKHGNDKKEKATKDETQRSDIALMDELNTL